MTWQKIGGRPLEQAFPQKVEKVFHLKVPSIDDSIFCVWEVLSNTNKKTLECLIQVKKVQDWAEATKNEITEANVKDFWEAGTGLQIVQPMIEIVTCSLHRTY